MPKLPRYVQERASPSGVISYRFNPPQNLVDEGVVKREEYGTDLKQVRKIVRDHNKAIDTWREEQSQIVRIKSSSKVTDLINYYYMSNDFNALRHSTKVDYRYFLTVLHQTMGWRKYENVTSKVAKQAYEEWVKRGISFANHAATCASRVYNYAIQMEHTTYNPWANIKRKSPQQRKIVWTHDDVVKFLDVAYSDFEYRNIGLIVQMAYEWCQRLGDMRMLTWDNIDFRTQKLSLEQSKRRADVELPISEDLLHMLNEQRKDFGFQEYVAPRVRPIGQSYTPYNIKEVSYLMNEVKDKAKLPRELSAMDLRRTAITEMVECGVDLAGVMQVSGHRSPQSVKPYLVNTYSGAVKALEGRNGNEH